MKATLIRAVVCGAALSAAAGPVHLWESNLVIPTYLAAPPSPVPRFYDGRTYQGAKATFYPYPVQDVLTDIKTNKSYKALLLENDYIQISVIPELGGRIWSAMDKVNGYDFFYRQHVVKPALIGMLGAWISGGVEWNVPHHHRASSFMPVDFTTTTNGDGSATIWVGEIELRHRMKWLVGMTLYPDRSYLELTCKVFNRTPFAWPMLFWINPAVHANTNYQVLFPPSTEWVTQHGKPEFASWPVARQNYGGSDYTRGVDISWWKNHDTPKSFFAWNYEDDWFGGYDHGRQAGVIHWADHHLGPGKKFFEWGNGPEGEMWTKILTDDDGPYLELMAGAWSDNQPDYSWIQPGETREWKHWWYPIRNMGGVKAATRDAAVNLEVTNGVVKVAVNATAEYPDARFFCFTPRMKVVFEKTNSIGPAKPFVTQFTLEHPEDGAELGLVLRTCDGKDLVKLGTPQLRNTPMPKPVEKPRSPKDYATADELYFTGQRIEQLYSPSFEASPYYEEILRRDPGDYRANTAMGVLLCKQWRWNEAAKFLSNAVARATANYIHPATGEAFYHLGVARKAQGRLDDAFEAFQKATWDVAWRLRADLAIAEIHVARREFQAARGRLAHLPPDAVVDFRTACLRAAVSRHLNDRGEAQKWASLADAGEPLSPLTRYEVALERRMAETDELYRSAMTPVERMMREEVQAHLELAVEYENLGLWDDAWNLLYEVATKYPQPTPLVLYHYAYCEEKKGRHEEATRVFKEASQQKPDLHFPCRFEEEPILRRAIEINPHDANAPYLLGCLLYDNQPENAVKAWEEARMRDNKFALTHRNLALAYAQHEKNIPKAIASLEKAIALDPNEPRFYYELDVQYEAGGTPVTKRLEMLTKHHDTVAKRDDALTREIVLLTVAGQADRALELLRSRHFRNWEGSGQIHSVYVDACLAQGQHLFADKRYREALAAYEAALEYPENLEVGRARRSPRTAQIQYLIGTAHEALGDSAQAKAAFEKAAAGRGGGDSESDYFRALALQKLGRSDETKPIFERLVKTGEEQLTKGETPDYFAKFGERTSERVRQANAHYLVGLGRLGLGQKEKAKAAFQQALELHPAHLGAVMQTTAAEDR